MRRSTRKWYRMWSYLFVIVSWSIAAVPLRGYGGTPLMVRDYYTVLFRKWCGLGDISINVRTSIHILPIAVIYVSNKLIHILYLENSDVCSNVPVIFLSNSNIIYQKLIHLSPQLSNLRFSNLNILNFQAIDSILFNYNSNRGGGLTVYFMWGYAKF